MAKGMDTDIVRNAHAGAKHDIQRALNVRNLDLSTLSGEGAVIRVSIPIRVTNPARTVVDCFKFRNQIGLDVALEALRDAWQQKKITMDEIWQIAQACRMTNVMRPYLESLV